MGKLYELLPAEMDLKRSAVKLISEAKDTFTKRTNHFVGHIKRTMMFNDEETTLADEVVDVTDTIDSKLAFVQEHISKYYDAYLNSQATNQKAVADIVLKGTVMATNIPATFLLGMEEKLKEIRLLYEKIPTLRPGVRWEIDDQQKFSGVYRAASPEEKFTTKKTVQHKILYEATPQHPAQIEKWTDDIRVGKIVTQNFSAMLSPADKAARLARIDELLIAVKSARQRANDIEATKMNIGKTMFTFIDEGKL